MLYKSQNGSVKGKCIITRIVTRYEYQQNKNKKFRIKTNNNIKEAEEETI